MNIPGMTKDVQAVRGYFECKGIRLELWPQVKVSKKRNKTDEVSGSNKGKDIIDDDHNSEARGDKENDDPYVRQEKMAEDTPPYPLKIEIVLTDVPTTTTSVGSKKRKVRGPTKSLKVTEPMHLEYNALGQPCGKWRRQYGK